MLTFWPRQDSEYRLIAISLLEAAIPRLKTADPAFRFADLSWISWTNEISQRWAYDDNDKLRAFAARMCTDAQLLAGFASDRSAFVRLVLAETLGRISRFHEHDTSVPVGLARKLLGDPRRCVRLEVCRQIPYDSSVAVQKQCAPLLMSYANREKDQAAKCIALASALRCAECDPETAHSFLESTRALDCDGHLSELGWLMGRIAGNDDVVLDLLKRLVLSPSAAHQHLAVIGFPISIFSTGRLRLDNPLRTLAQAIDAHCCKSHFMIYALLLEDADAREDEMLKPHLPDLALLLKSGFLARDPVVRLWATRGAWRCAAFHHSVLSGPSREILTAAAADADWRLRFACAIHGGAVPTTAPAESCASAVDLIRQLCSPLLGDGEELVRAAAAFALEQARAEHHDRTNESTNCARFQAMQKSSLDIQVGFYCRESSWICSELQFEIDALAVDRSDIVIPLWKKMPERIEALVDQWSRSSSEGLRKTARSFRRKTGRHDWIRRGGG